MSLPNLAQTEQQRTDTVAKTPRRRWKWGAILLIGAVASVYAANYLSSQFERSVLKAGGTYARQSPVAQGTLINHIDIIVSAMLGNPRYNNVITFRGGSLQDAWLEQNKTEIAELNMVTLILQDGATSIDGLRALEGLKSVCQLDISRSDVSNEALDSVISMPNLLVIGLGGTGISDHSLHKLSALPGLQAVSIDADQATEIGLKHLAELPCLGTLIIDGATDKTIELLDPAWKLTTLSLIKANLSVDSIPNLKQLSSVQILTLQGLKLTPEQLQMFRDELPNRHIFSYTVVD